MVRYLYYRHTENREIPSARRLPHELVDNDTDSVTAYSIEYHTQAILLYCWWWPSSVLQEVRPGADEDLESLLATRSYILIGMEQNCIFPVSLIDFISEWRERRRKKKQLVWVYCLTSGKRKIECFDIRWKNKRKKLSWTTIALYHCAEVT